MAQVAGTPSLHKPQARCLFVHHQVQVVWMWQRRRRQLGSGRELESPEPRPDDPILLEADDPANMTYIPGAAGKTGYNMVCRHVRRRRGCSCCTAVAYREHQHLLALGFIDTVSLAGLYWSQKAS